MYNKKDWWMQSNLEKSSTTKVSKKFPSGFSMSIISSINSIKNKHDMCRGKGCMKAIFKLLRERIMKIFNFKRKNMKPLKKEQWESYENSIICYNCKKKLKINIWKIKDIVKLENIFIL